MKNSNYIRRAIAFIIDWNIIFIIIFCLMSVGENFDIKHLLVPTFETTSVQGVIMAAVAFIILPLIKDISGASIGKMIVGLKVVNAADGEKPRISQLVIKNITFYLVYVEAIVFLVNKGKMLGNMISKTKVIRK